MKAPVPPAGVAPALRERAQATLEANWTGRSTVPSRRLYPHQWGWDTAFSAIGWTRVNCARGAIEIESLLAGQWADGRVPQIVFDPGVPEEAYFPGPGFWRSEQAPGSPREVRTSGLVQPPLHARASLTVAERWGDAAAAEAFLRRVYPRLAAFHAYLGGPRASASGLAVIVHPWESGLDNAPAWDAPLARVELPAGGLKPYRRQDLRHVDAGQRPTEAAYDRFVHLARTYRDAGYDDTAPRPWAVEDPLFNAILLWSTEALGAIAERLGEDPRPHRDAGERLHAALLERCWDPAAGRFAARDVRTDERLENHSILGVAPLLDPALPSEVVGALAAELCSPHLRPPAGDPWAASYDRLAADFDRARYWRGPVWASTNWLLARGLAQHGRTDLARELEDATLRLVAAAGFHEYFDALSGEGYGSGDFTWTAAVVLDILDGR